MCQPCFHETPEALDLACARLMPLASWRQRLTRRFHRHVRRVGYSATSAITLAKRFAATVHDDKAIDLRGFVANVNARLALHLCSVGQLRGLDAHLARFLRGTQMAGVELREASACAGRTIGILESMPIAFRDDAKRWYAATLAERAHRRETDERSTSEKAIFNRVRTIVDWAKWLVGQSLTSWQQLTPLRFRARMKELEVVDGSGAVSAHFDVLNSYFQWLREERRLFVNPLLRMRRPRVPELRQHAVHDEELRVWLRRATDSDRDAGVRAIGLLAILHGLTMVEIRLLQRTDFDQTRRTIKARRRRLVLDLDPLTADALAAYLRIRPRAKDNRHLFLSTKTRLGSQAVSTGFVAARMRELGVLGRVVRQRLIVQLAVDEHAIVAARYFGVSVATIDKHLNHQAVLFLKENPASTEFLQDNR